MHKTRAPFNWHRCGLPRKRYEPIQINPITKQPVAERSASPLHRVNCRPWLLLFVVAVAGLFLWGIFG